MNRSRKRLLLEVAGEVIHHLITINGQTVHTRVRFWQQLDIHPSIFLFTVLSGKVLTLYLMLGAVSFAVIAGLILVRRATACAMVVSPTPQPPYSMTTCIAWQTQETCKFVHNWLCCFLSDCLPAIAVT